MRKRSIIALLFIFGLSCAATCPALAHSLYSAESGRAMLDRVSSSLIEALGSDISSGTFVEFVWVKYSWPRDRWTIAAIIAVTNAIALGVWHLRLGFRIQNQVLATLVHCGALMCKVVIMLIAFAVLAHPLLFSNVPMKDWLIALYVGFVPLIVVLAFRGLRRLRNAQ